jgi:hypothetical protein
VFKCGKGEKKGKKPTPHLLFLAKEQFLGRKGKKEKSQNPTFRTRLNEMLNPLPSPSLSLNFHLIPLSHPTLERKTLTPPLTTLFVKPISKSSYPIGPKAINLWAYTQPHYGEH